MTTFAYVRVSTRQQDNENQSHGIKDYAKSRGWAIDVWYEDSVSGRKSWRERQVASILAAAKKGDRLVVAEYSRLARSTLQVLEIVAEAAKIGVEIHVVKSNLVLDGSMSAKIISTVMSLASEIERDFIATRTAEALAVRREKGLPMGRPKGESSTLALDAQAEKIDHWHSLKIGKRAIAKLADCSPATLYLWIKRRRPDWLRAELPDEV